jgi:ABC-type polysaccharide/polyol phosphate transport system ATPase subunit
MNKEISLKLSNVSKTFRTSSKSFSTLKNRLINFYKKNEVKKIKALKDINLEIYAGETIGIIGRNGSGKSTLTKIMSGTFIPDRGGEVIKNGTSLLLNLGVGFSHELSARENIYVNGSTLGLRISEIDELFDKILEFSELEEFKDTKIKYFSSGMIQRLSFSIAIFARADIIFLDEVFAVGDDKFKKKATEALKKNWLKNRTSIIVSHSTGVIKDHCDRTILLHKGELLFFGDTKEAISKYQELE